MPRTETSNFSFLSDKDPLLYEISSSAETVFIADPNITLVKLRQLAEQLTRNVAANLGIATVKETKFFDLIADVKSKIEIDDKILRLLHYLRKQGNDAVHDYNQDRSTASRALQSARELCVWYYRTFCHAPSNFKPGPFIQPRDRQQEEQDQHHEIVRLKTLLEKEREGFAQHEALIKSLREQEEHLRTIAEERAEDAKAAFELAEEQSRRLEKLSAEYETRLANMARECADGMDTAEISERSRRASEYIEATWAPEINLGDAFDDYQLTPDQGSLIRELDEFLRTRDQNVFILAGHAGTGKTFITRGLSNFLAATGRSCVITAPTGKAARVITQKSGRLATTIHKKIYSMDDIREYKVDDVDGSETFKLYAELEVNGDADNTVYIVDESSMVSDVYSEGEFFRFGSGQLLSDLMKYVNLDHNDHTKKVIFIGDSAQLPPVGMNFSPALDQKYLGKKFGIIHPRKFELSQVVRQAAESGILSSANTLRDSLSKKAFNKLSLATDAQDVCSYADIEELVSGYLEACENKVGNAAMIIASSNADVAMLNEQVRCHIFPGKEHVTRGDKLVVVMNCIVEGVGLNNGDLVYVERAEDLVESKQVMLRNKNNSTGVVEEIGVTLKFRDLRIAFRRPEGDVVRADVKIVESLLYSNHSNLSSDETKALYIYFKSRHPELPKAGKVLRDALREDPYFNALRVKFGYALTCHKAQGSEWQNVFIQCKTYMQPRTEEYFRWLYTAITRASGRLYLLNAPSLKPWDDLRPVPFTASPAIPNPLGSELDKESPAHSTAEPTLSCPSQNEAGLIDSSLNMGDPVRDGIYNAISRSLADMPGVKIDSIDHHAWQEVYYISDSARTTRINISYNKKGIIGSITPVQKDAFGANIATRLSGIVGSHLIGQALPEREEVQFSREVFNEFFPLFVEKAALNGLRIDGFREESWNLRIGLGNSRSRGEVAIYCDGSGRITKHMWIGSPPQDPSLRESLESTMAALS